ncbi:helix-turn-helix domain-containing protein [Streptomyces sp. NPDC004111]|uniref:helix-turn-helix domain-containing protein n=1 Tax=Streptomyces sp. NPDC004111 TaxID=3364690 RepID=UPI0036CFD789
MPSITYHGVGPRVAYERRIASLTQAQLAERAGVSLGTIRKVERNERGVSAQTLDDLATALNVDTSRLLPGSERPDDRVHRGMPALSRIIATCDVPDDGPVRPLQDLELAVAEATQWRLGAQYVRISRHLPPLLGELSRALASAAPAERAAIAALLVGACRTADAVAYKYGAHDLSARLVELMRWAAPQAQDPLLDSVVAYVRTETFFAAAAHDAGLRVLEQAIDRSPAPVGPATRASRGTLHMRAAVVAGRAANAGAAAAHLAEARALSEGEREGVFLGTAWGPDSVRIHQVSVAVSLGGDHVSQALAAAGEWAPPQALPAERRSGFWIELARAQLWAGRPDRAFESLKVARRVAPQHTREHRWVKEDAGTLRRLKRADAEELTQFAQWCQAS